MSDILPRLRGGIDILPSPDADRPGIVMRDPLRYSDAVLYLPPAWVMALSYLDGEHSELDLQEALTRATGQLVFSTDIRKFVCTLQEQGFLETEEFARLRERKQAEFRAAAQREPIHAGTAYPASAAEAHSALRQFLEVANQLGDSASSSLQPPASSLLVGVAAPHVSPEGGRNCYAAAYAAVAAHPELTERTFVILGTSHYGQPERFGLTSKPFVTPLGTLRVDMRLFDWLAQNGGEALCSEDYCHSIEHSIEFQCLFLQEVLGSDLKILPILCGPFAESLATGQTPESNAQLDRFFQALREMAEQQTDKLFWVLGIDLSHIGRRYGDLFAAVADRGRMVDVAEQDRRRIEQVCAGHAGRFFSLVKRNQDELRWCGYSPLYTFLRAVPSARGRLLRYEQWNIDSQSVVSFAGLQFTEAGV